MNFLDAHPKAAAICAAWREHGQFVPHLWLGKLCGTDGDIMMARTVPDPLSAEDFIIGMELLGYRFSVGMMRGEPALVRLEPEPMPRAWHVHSLCLMAAFSHPDATAQAIAFLLERDRD